MAYQISKADIDGTTGHIQLTVRAMEKSATGSVTLGPPETIGLWPRALNNIHAALFGTKAAQSHASLDKAINSWLAGRHAESIERKHAIERAAAVVYSLKGKTIEFGDTVDTEGRGNS